MLALRVLKQERGRIKREEGAETKDLSVKMAMYMVMFMSEGEGWKREEGDGDATSKLPSHISQTPCSKSVPRVQLTDNSPFPHE